MIVLPIVDRELRVRARQAGTYWLRFGVGMAVCLIGVSVMVVNAGATIPAAAGASAFHSLAWLGFFLACASVLLTSDCISGERREGTLGFLFLTNLHGYDVVLGKLAAVGLGALYALFGFLPALALVFLHGGVSRVEVARTSLALINTLLVSLAVGMWVSSRAAAQHRANRNSLLLITGLMVVPWLVGPMFFGMGKIASIIALASPYSAFHLAQSAGDTGLVSSATRFWLALVVTQLEVWLLLGAAAVSLLHRWRETGEPASLDRSDARLELQTIGAAAATQASGAKSIARALFQNDPVCWAVSRRKGQMAMLWAGTLLMLGQSGFSMLFMLWFRPAVNGLVNSLYMFLNFGAGALLAWAAGRYFYEAKASGELELLLATPLGSHNIIAGCWRALWHPLRGVWLFMVFLILLEFLFMPGHTVWRTGPGYALMVVRTGLHPIIRGLDVVALCWVGMWFGLRARKPVFVIAWTVGLVLGLPWAVSYLVMVWLSIGSRVLYIGATSPSYTIYLWFMPVFDIAKNIFLIRWAARELRSELRVSTPLAVAEWFK